MEFIPLGEHVDAELWNWYLGDYSATQRAIWPSNGLIVEFWSIETWGDGSRYREIGITPSRGK